MKNEVSRIVSSTCKTCLDTWKKVKGAGTMEGNGSWDIDERYIKSASSELTTRSTLFLHYIIKIVNT